MGIDRAEGVSAESISIYGHPEWAMSTEREECNSTVEAIVQASMDAKARSTEYRIQVELAKRGICYGSVIEAVKAALDAK